MIVEVKMDSSIDNICIVKYLTLIVVLSSAFISCKGNDVLGCNGFIKSDIDINFSLVEVKLYTKSGSLKDHTECAPNNGYYFLPLYDKGEYILRVSPPPGWSFEPSEVALNADGVSDSCSQGKDINFFFKGFAVTGRVVSAGEDTGPKGIKVELLSPSDSGKNVQLLTTMTTEDGKFLFTPVLPGNYIVQASHPSWRVSKNRVAVTVKNGNTEVPNNSLVIAGYDISGKVTSDGEPITGVSFVLFKKSGSASVPIVGCDSSTLQGFSASVDKATLLCHVTSDSNGNFVYPSLPSGDYVIVPYYKGSQQHMSSAHKSIKFDVQPQSLDFTVRHSSLQLQTQFQVKGFSVNGRVLWSAGGKPMEGVTVLLDNKVVTKTGSDGVFYLESMKAGNYKLQLQARNVLFEEKTIKVSPNSAHLGDITPESYQVCGKVTAQTGTATAQNRLVVFKNSQTGQVKEAKTDSTGQFCLYLSPCKYMASVPVSDEDRDKGLQFAPVSREVTVSDTAVSGIDFSQLRATVLGTIECLESKPCPDLTVTLRSHDDVTTVAKGGKYKFENVLPGDYTVIIDPNIEWCWENEVLPLTVSNTQVEGPAFKQTGVAVTIVSSHATKVKMTQTKTNSTKVVTHELDATAGTSKHCVLTPGEYSGTWTLKPVGCHGYSEPSVEWTGGPVELNAVTHEYVGQIVTAENVLDLIVNVIPTDEKAILANSIKKLGPLKPEKSVDTEGELVYTFKLQLAPLEVVTLVPAASSLLFNPMSTEISGGNDCSGIEERVVFVAERGKVVSGKVIGNNVPLPGVLVTIYNEQGKLIASQVTDSEGRYKFGPLSAASNYIVTAEKEGYVLSRPNKDGDLSAHKLAEVIVDVTDKADGTPLQGVLLSLSGGENYRRNSQTGPDGTMAFLSLSPSEYYLRPMMKEYRFDPPSKMIAVEEGATVKVSFSGQRVAYSVFGSVTTLSGEAEGGVTVEAVGRGNPECSQLQEESSSESNGQFRIRGLQPQCEYSVRVKQGSDVNLHIQRSTPDEIVVQVTNKDIHGLHLIVFRPVSRTDVTAYITADTPEYLRTLRARLYREDVQIYTVSLSDLKATSTFALKSVAIALPPVPADGRGYYIQLESSLSQNTHSYSTYPVHFRANSSFHLVRLNFSPVPRTHEHELSHTSYLAVPLFLIAVILYFNRATVYSLITQLMDTKFNPNSSYSARQSLIDDGSNDAGLIVEQIGTGKRKSKPRKT